MLLQTSIVALLACMVSGQGFYGKSGPVIDLNPASFKELVLNSDQASVVEFYAPWCGHCKTLKPEYIKAAKKTSPLVPFYAVNCDDEINKPICGKYKIQGFPTIKSFRPGKKKGGKHEVHDCDVERKAKWLADYAYSRIPNGAAIVTKKKVDKWLKDNAEKTRVVLISKAGQSGVPALWKVLSSKFKNEAAFAFVPAKQGISEKFAAGIDDDSKSQLIVIEGDSNVVYDGDLKREPVEQFLQKIFATGIVDVEGEKHVEEDEDSAKGEKTSEETVQTTEAVQEEPVTAKTTKEHKTQKARLVEEKVRIVRPHDHSDEEADDIVDNDDFFTDEEPTEPAHPEITPDPSDKTDPSKPNPWKRVSSFEQIKKECINDGRPCVILGTSVYGQLEDFKNVNSARVEIGKSLNDKFKFVYVIDIDDETKHMATELGLAPYSSPISEASKGKREWSHAGSLAVVSKGKIANLEGKVEFQQIVQFLTDAADGQLSLHPLPKRYAPRSNQKEDL